MGRLMNQQQRAVIKQAIDVLEKTGNIKGYAYEREKEARAALRQLLEQPVQEPKQNPPFIFKRFVAGSERAQDVAVHRENTLDAAIRVAAKICPPADHPTVLVYTPPLVATPLAQPADQTDIADIIAGELKVSRGTAYDLMREALKELDEQAAPVQEPVAWMHKQGNHEEPSFRQLDDWEIQNGWEQYPLYTTPPAQPEPVQQKPLFADIIAQHPGLAEELKAMDAAPVQEPSLLATLKAVQGTLISANEQGQIADTIWFSAYETLFDFIDAEIDKAEQATPPAQPAVLSLEESLKVTKVCCGDYANCNAPCTPRGRWQAHQEPDACTWSQVDDEYTPDTWEATCGAMWTFTDGGPKDNDMKFCPNCGNHVEQKGTP
jgi:hypothetical protein